MSRARIVAAVALVWSGAYIALAPAASAEAAACPAPAPMTFGEPRYIDTERAGGEPSVATHPDGTLLVGSHAGTTHFFFPEGANPNTIAFPQRYKGQTYYYWSADNGKTWTFVPRDLPPENVIGSGFSDPDFAIDSAGFVYISEINLVNVAMSSSADAGRSYVLENFFAETMHDRQWSEADTRGVVYLTGNSLGGGTSTSPAGKVGHYLYRTTDGGKTFTPGTSDAGGLGDIKVDKRDGTLYEAHYGGQTLSIAAFREARSGDLKRELHRIAEGVGMLSHWPSLDIDQDGNIYIVWDESGDGRAEREAGIWYSRSTDHGRTWASPARVDTDDRTDIWPWLAVGDRGRVAIAWFQADIRLPGHDAQTPGGHGWRVAAAQTINGLGCPTSATPGFTVSIATREPLHRGTVCQGGTICQAQAIDRRLGDYFTVEVDSTGHMWAVYSDTRRGGAVALASFVRQSSGELFLRPKPTASPQPAPALAAGEELPATGGGTSLLAWVLVIVTAALGLRARRLLQAIALSRWSGSSLGAPPSQTS